MHDFNFAWHLLCTSRFQLLMEQQRRVTTSGALFFSLIILFFVTFLVSTSNPFLKVPFPCLNSLAELNPVLQDPVLAIHPPCIYAGYVASALSFSLCLAKINYDLASHLNRHWLLNFNLNTVFYPNPNKSSLKFLRYRSKVDLRRTADDLFRTPRSFIAPSCINQNNCRGAQQKSNLLSNKTINLSSFDAKQKTTVYETSNPVTLSISTMLQFWMLACWSFLTVGILLGSWWAYHELGWGGWWFWDPVENASLMPWLLATACIHMNKVRSKVLTHLALNLSTFVLSILGTFFVRSGLLASVHSFATDSTRGLYLFLFLLSISVLAVVKIYQIQSNRKQIILKTRLEQILSLQNFFFCVICAVILCGTSAPLVFLWLWNRDVSTGAPFYNGTLIPLFTSVFFMLVYTHYAQLRLSLSPLVCACKLRSCDSTNLGTKLCCCAPALRRLGLCSFRRKKPNWTFLRAPFGTWSSNLNGPVISCIILCYFFHIICLNVTGFSILESTYGTICILLISSFILSKKKIASLFFSKMLSKMQPSRLIGFLTLGTQKKTLSMKIAHTGIVIFVTGILLSNTFKFQLTQLMHSGSVIRLGAQQVCCLRSIDHAYAPTYHSICGNLLISKPDGLLYPNTKAQSLLPGAQQVCMFPEKRFFYSNQELTTTKVAIHTNMFTDWYGLIGTGSMETGWFTTIMKLPFIFCIWLGFLLGTIGGALALKKQLQKSKLKWV